MAKGCASRLTEARRGAGESVSRRRAHLPGPVGPGASVCSLVLAIRFGCRVLV